MRSLSLRVPSSPSLLYLSLCVLVMSLCYVSLTGFHVPLFVLHPCLPSLSCVPMFAYLRPSVCATSVCATLFYFDNPFLSLITFSLVPLLLYVLFVPAVFPSGLHPSIPPLVYMWSHIPLVSHQSLCSSTLVFLRFHVSRFFQFRLFVAF